MSNRIFCTSRTNARLAAKIQGGKVQDNGSKAANGQRWEVIFEQQPEPIKVQHKNIELIPAYFVCSTKRRNIPVVVKRKRTFDATLQGIN